MENSKRREYCSQIGIALSIIAGSFFSWHRAIAQVVPDNTLGTESSVVTPNVDVKDLPSDRIDGGAIRGSGLFHSFQELNVREGRGVYFNNPAGIENIFSRVTGRSASNIFGTLGVLGDANLFLLNPNGIIFGPNSKLDIGGSFFGSTANSLIFEDGEFSARNPGAPPLLSMKVPLGVQFGPTQPSAIVNSGNLSVGENMTLTGGTVVSTGDLSAPQGEVALAAVSNQSRVNINASAGLVNIATPSSVSSENSLSLSLAEFLVNVDEKAIPGLTVSNGQVKLADSGLSVEDGDVVAKNVTAQTATLTAKNNLILVESLLGTNADLNLLAGDTVRVRDSVNNPFVAQAGGKLLVQGKQGVDIFALNHPSSGLFSGGDMVLRSRNTVGGDAHYWAGGNFSIEEMDGSLGGLFSPYDPVIRASGDVSFDSYTGASLHIFAGGSVEITGNVEITGADPDFGLDEQQVELSDGESITIDGKNSPTLDIRAGVRADAIGTPEFTPTLNFPGNGNEIDPNPPIATDSPTGANITIGSIVNRQPDGQIFLTNQYEPNNELSGDIKTEIIDVNADVTIDSRGAIDTTGGRIDVSGGVDSENNIKLIADGNITTANLLSDLMENNNGDGGEISLFSRNGAIDTTRGNIISKTGDGVAGNITLEADGDIRTGNIEASSNSSTGVEDNFSVIELNSSQGSVILNRVELTTNNTGSDLAGTIDINGKNILINESNTSSTGNTGEIFIGTNVDDEVTTESVTINNSKLTTTNNSNTGVAGDIEINGKEIQITDTNDNNERDTTIESKGDSGRIFIGVINNPDKANTVTADKVTIENSILRTTNNFEADKSGNIEINANSQNGSVSLIKDTELQAQTSGTKDAGNIIIDANNVTFDSSRAFATVEPGGTGKGGSININATDSLLITNGAQLQALVREQANGVAGNIGIFTDNLGIEKGGKLFVSSEQGQAGNVEIRADTIGLNNGEISALTGQKDQLGGNIILLGKNTTDEQVNTLNEQISQGQQRGENLPGDSLDHLLLSNESLIEANARNEADGGNISIKTRVLLAGPETGERGSDITANAEQGNGGIVAIDSRPLGIYNIEFRDIKPEESATNKLNDITASSNIGLNGIVSVVEPDIDPRRGLLELPEDLGDSSKFITPDCPVGTTQAENRLRVTGRGGLPPSPSSPLSSDAFIGNTTTNASPRETPTAQNSSAGSTLVEAKGIKIGPKGEIILTANPSKPIYDNNSWQRNRGCNVR